MTTPAQALVHHLSQSERLDAWIASLSSAELAVLPYVFDVWARPEQHIPTRHWRTCGLDGGRGFGKGYVLGRFVNDRVMAGLESRVALAAPTDDRVEEVQRVALIEYAEPWQRPERKGKGLIWPNGVEAIAFSSDAPERGRGDNVSLLWCTEIVAWKPHSREAFFNNLYTACRVGEARVVWDSTAKGRNEVRAKLEMMHELDPEQHVIIHGTMFDNPLLSTAYLRSQWLLYPPGVRRDEELFGKSFREAGGALWKQIYFDRSRVKEAPGLEWLMVTVDPATSQDESADETGIVRGGRAKDGHVYVTDDRSGKYAPEDWGDIAVELANPSRPGAGRIGIERKRIGDQAAFVLKSRAENRKWRTRVIGRDEPWPAWDPGCIFIREYNTNDSKGTRADGPAVETEAGRVHLVEPDPDAEKPIFAELEKECVTYVPGVTVRSPNRLDAFAYLVAELRELKLDSPKDHGRDAKAAEAANAALQERLSRGSVPAGRIVGGLDKSGGLGAIPARRMGL